MIKMNEKDDDQDAAETGNGDLLFFRQAHNGVFDLPEGGQARLGTPRSVAASG